jgi:hypothetical protein
MLIGGFLLILGLAFTILGKMPFIGRLPGDIVFNRGNFTVCFPIVTMLLLSLVLTVIINIVLRIFRA